MFFIGILLVLFFFLELEGVAQCAMCKENLQYDLDNGNGIGKNINQGILYLMAIPYLLLGVVGAVLYYNKRSKKLF